MDTVPAATPEKQLTAQIEHPSPQVIWSRAVEVFGDEDKARSWMNTPRDIFGGRSPQDLSTCGNEEEQRRVLRVLIRIEYGVLS